MYLQRTDNIRADGIEPPIRKECTNMLVGIQRKDKTIK